MIKRVDYGGAILCVIGIVLFLIGFTWAITYGWNSVQALAPLLIGFAVMFCFVLFEWKVPSEPNVPLRLFKNKNFSVSVFALFTIGWGMNGSAFYLPQMFQLVRIGMLV